VGRKSTDKQRRARTDKTTQWVAMSIPLFLSQGIRHLSMDDVALHLGISKATLYTYFASREALLQAAVEVKLTQIGAFQRLLASADTPFVDRFYSALNYTVQELSSISTDFLADLQALYPQLWHQVIRFIDFAITALDHFYAQGVAEGVFKPYNTTILALTDRVILTSFSDPDLLRKYNLTYHEAVNEYFRIKFFGLFVGQTEKISPYGDIK